MSRRDCCGFDRPLGGRLTLMYTEPASLCCHVLMLRPLMTPTSVGVWTASRFWWQDDAGWTVSALQKRLAGGYRSVLGAEQDNAEQLCHWKMNVRTFAGPLFQVVANSVFSSKLMQTQQFLSNISSCFVVWCGWICTEASDSRSDQENQVPFEHKTSDEQINNLKLKTWSKFLISGSF